MTANRLVIDDDSIERDLVKLVLTVVELLRQLMERQALRRVDKGDLTEDQEERIGRTLMLLEHRMARLRERYRLSDQDLNLDLGPLGPLLPAMTQDPAHSRARPAETRASRRSRSGPGRSPPAPGTAAERPLRRGRPPAAAFATCSNLWHGWWWYGQMGPGRLRAPRGR
jgi:hypothetical protein